MLRLIRLTMELNLMHENQHNDVSRRSLVKRGICALAGIAIASLAGTKKTDRIDPEFGGGDVRR